MINSSQQNFKTIPSQEFNDLISVLISLDPNSTYSLEELHQKIDQKHKIPHFENIRKYIETLAYDLIFKQFVKPSFEAAREIVSNSLDAQIRSNREKQPIKIALEGRVFKIEDAGDGINVPGLINFLVPGRSSNAKAIFDLDKGISKVTGRFGQGALASFFYLLHHLDSNFSPLPEITFENNLAKLQLICQIKDALYKYTFSVLETTKGKFSITVDSEKLPSPPSEKREMHFHTFREGFSPLKISFQEINKKIQVDISESDKKTLGTSISIHSPIINTEGKRIAEYLKETFLFVRSSPIHLNDKLLNDTSNFQTIEFEGGEIYYDPNKTDGDEEAVLYICEGGKNIRSFSIDDAPCFKKVCFNLHKLKLSQDRSTINFEDPSFSKPLVNLLLELKKLDWHIKAPIYNALAPIVKSNKKFLAHIKQEALAICKESMSKAIAMLDPIYIDLKQFEYLKAGTNWRVFINKNQTDHIIHFVHDEYYFIILSDKIFHKNHRDITLLNYSLIETFISNKFPDIQNFSLAETKIQEQPPTLKFAGAQDTSKYENMPGADVKFFLSDYAEDKELFNDSKEAQNIIQNWLKYPYSREFLSSRKYMYYFKDFWDKNHKLIAINDQREFIQFSFRYAYISGMNLSIYSSLLENTLTVYNSLNEIDRHDFLEKFLLKAQDFLLLQIAKQPFSYQNIYETFYNLRKVFEYFEFDDPDEDSLAKEIFTRRMNSNIDEYIKLAQKVKYPDERRKLFYYLGHILQDPSNLVKMADDEFDTFLSCLPDEETEKRNLTMSINAIPLKGDDYYLLSVFLFSKDYTLEYKKTLFQMYCYGTRIYTGLKPDHEEILNHYIKLSSSWEEEEIDSKGAKICKNLSDLCHFQSQNHLHMINYTTDRKGLFPIDEAPPVALEIKNLVEKWEKNGKKDPNDYLAMCQFYLDFWEKESVAPPSKNQLILKSRPFITEVSRPFIYSVMLAGTSQAASDNFTFTDPTAQSATIPLHEDPFLIKNLGSPEMAKISIHNAVNQIMDKDALFAETVKNAREAKATKMDVSVHTDPHDNLIVVIQDNGSGMDFKELDILKCPGSSTKRKEINQKNPNYGWGFFTCFQFDEVYVQTVKNNQLSCLTFTKQPEQLLTRSASVNLEASESGTKIILKKNKPVHLSLELILIRCALISRCRNFEKIEISFNGKLIHNYPSIDYESDHTFSLPYLNSFVTAEIKTGAEGLYCNGIRMGDVHQLYTSILPSPIQSLLKEVDLSVTIPKVEQLRNRSSLIENPALTTIIQKCIFGVLLTYAQQKLINQQLPALRDDFWSDFKNTSFHLSSHQEAILDVIKNGFEDTSKQEFFKFIADHLKKMMEEHQESLSFPLYNCDGNELINKLTIKPDAAALLNLKKTINNETDLLFMLLHLPIDFDEDNTTIFEAREVFITALKDREILLDDNSYNLKKIEECSLEDLKKIINNSFNLSELELGCLDWEKFGIKFKKSICDKIEILKKETSQKLESVTSDILIEFSKKFALERFKKNINIEFSSAIDTYDARASKKTNTVIFSGTTNFARSFVKMTQQNPKYSDLMSKYFHLVKKLIDLNVHELTHLDGPQSHDYDKHHHHTQEFFDIFSHNIATLLVTDPTQPSVLNLLDESLRLKKKEKLT